MAYGNSTGGYVNNIPTVMPTGYNQTSMPVVDVNSNPFGFIEVNGIEGVNRYPVAPGAGVILKDATSDLVFIKARDMSGAGLPLRVFRMFDVTDEFTQDEAPVTRKELKQLQSSIGEIKGLLEFLTSPSTPKEDSNA